MEDVLSIMENLGGKVATLPTNHVRRGCVCVESPGRGDCIDHSSSQLER